MFMFKKPNFLDVRGKGRENAPHRRPWTSVRRRGLISLTRMVKERGSRARNLQMVFPIVHHPDVKLNMR